MKVIYDHQIFTLLKYGGIPRYFCEIAKRLANLDAVDVSIVSPLYVNKYLNDLDKGNKVGLYVPWGFRGAEKLVCMVNRFCEPCLISRASPEITHATYYSEKNYTPSNSKFVITVFDMIHEKISWCFKPSDNITKMKMAAVHKSDHIICISEKTRQDLIEVFDVNPDKTTVTRLASSLSLIPDAKRIVTEPYILYVGPRYEYKNFKGLLKAYASSAHLSSDFRLVCFGGGAFRKEERLFQKQLKIPDNRLIQLSGNDELLASLYMHAAVFVYPSLYEGFGIPPLEAMNCDCPVVCSNTGSLPEVVGSAAKTFDPYQGEDIRQSIEDIVYQSEKARSLVKAGRKRTALFSWDKCALETLEVYRKTLGVSEGTATGEAS